MDMPYTSNDPPATSRMPGALARLVARHGLAIAADPVAMAAALRVLQDPPADREIDAVVAAAGSGAVPRLWDARATGTPATDAVRNAAAAVPGLPDGGSSADWAVMVLGVAVGLLPTEPDGPGDEMTRLVVPAPRPDPDQTSGFTLGPPVVPPTTPWPLPTTPWPRPPLPAATAPPPGFRAESASARPPRRHQRLIIGGALAGVVAFAAVLGTTTLAVVPLLRPPAPPPPPPSYAVNDVAQRYQLLGPRPAARSRELRAAAAAAAGRAHHHGVDGDGSGIGSVGAPAHRPGGGRHGPATHGTLHDVLGRHGDAAGQRRAHRQRGPAHPGQVLRPAWPPGRGAAVPGPEVKSAALWEFAAPGASRPSTRCTADGPSEIALEQITCTDANPNVLRRYMLARDFDWLDTFRTTLTDPARQARHETIKRPVHRRLVQRPRQAVSLLRPEPDALPQLLDRTQLAHPGAAERELGSRELTPSAAEQSGAEWVPADQEDADGVPHAWVAPGPSCRRCAWAR